ncbi:MAG: protein kinase [Acidobacteriota bacterium]|nr:protein kinase [Acidobacteriota bacterium]
MDATQDLTRLPSAVAAGARQLRAGDVLGGRFEIARYISRGGMGEVYEACDRQLQGKHIALKVLRAEIAGDGAMRERFEREVLMAREVAHRNVCPTYDLSRMEGPRGPVVFLTMRLLRGESLSARLRRVGRLSPELSLSIARQMAEGLDAAHRSGVIHGDFKPGNVMLEGVGDDVRVSITDFGLSRLYHSDESVANATGVIGTPGYIAPELLAGAAASPASDVFAFGLVVQEMITGERWKPIAGPDPVPPPKLPGRWQDVVDRCLAPDPERRAQSAGEVLALLDNPAANNLNTTKGRTFSRRGLILTGAGGAVAAAGWFMWPVADSLLHPLPEKRFVALMAWPGEPASNVRPVLNGVLDAIAGSLSRAETSMKNLLVLRPADAGAQTPSEPRQAVLLLGVNLVLGASLHIAEDTWTLILRVVEASAGRVLREKRISSVSAEVALLPERAVVTSAALLQIPADLSRARESQVSRLSSGAWQEFAAAEELMLQPNDTGLDKGIAAYQRALEAEPRFALGYARLTLAYIRKYQLTREDAPLLLAGTNADRALQIDPKLAAAILSRALVDLYTGRTPEAMLGLARAQKLDPGNTKIQMYQAQAFADLSQSREQEACYRRILAERPNFWPAYNELGALQYREGKIKEAAVSFQEASALAPQVVRPLINIGSMFLLLKRRAEAAEAFRRSIENAPNELAYLNLGNLAFEDKDYSKALNFYGKARDLNPRSHQTFRDIGDCYDVLGRPSQVRENYTRAADLLEGELKVNPRPGRQWMRLAFYDAKAGRREKAEADLRTGDQHGAPEIPAQFFKAQAEAVLGRNQDALRLVLECLDRGLSTVEVDLALDLRSVRADPRYRSRVAALKQTALNSH